MRQHLKQQRKGKSKQSHNQWDSYHADTVVIAYTVINDFLYKLILCHIIRLLLFRANAINSVLYTYVSASFLHKYRLGGLYE